ncbi:MAG TPA: AMP-binding protein, partial [Thermoleophilaceae bacterium]|nr:AMP-binding protein [Thermoleophilaceae bacterium]
MADAPPVLWRPSAERVERATMTRFMRAQGHGDYDSLWRWSVEDVEGFWAAIWDFFGLGGSAPYERVLGSREMPGAEWFLGAELSYAEHIFRGKDDADVAIRHSSELRDLNAVSWGELREQAGRIASGLRALGVGPGDRVAAYMPNIPETIAAFLACASIGAVWSSAAPEFGARSVVDRFQQIEPKVLLAIDGYRYGGKDFDRSEAVAGIGREIGARVVRFGYLDGSGWEDGFLG